MLQTRTAIAHPSGIAAVVPGIAAVDRLGHETALREAYRSAERALDDVLADSFPASDPPSWNPGIHRPYSAGSFTAGLMAARDGYHRPAVADGVDVSRPAQGQRTGLQALVSLAGALGIALFFGVAVLLLGLPVVLIARGVLEAIGWLFGVSIQ